ncbi:MAG TPA: hypothetical protein VGL94_21325 [Ktedonobacteraceae bacterium]|jgi:hypothetical protein
METQSTPRPLSQGTCVFCKAELAKNKMTQHLKFCKQRLATLATQEQQSQEMKTRLFHILAEGQYNPQYWLHFEVPASEPLWSLDDFLKDMWIDDLDHLSGFTINGTNYSTDYPDDFFFFSEEEKTEEEDLSEEEEEKELREVIDEVVSQFAERFASSLGIPFNSDPQTAEWVAEIKRPRSVDELIDFLKAERVRIKKEERSVWKDEQDIPVGTRHRRTLTLQYQKIIVEQLLDEVEDCSMEVSLGRVLKVGQKFSYIYDYGSSTYINLRVIGEREGIIQEKKEPVQLLAQNTAPAFPCTVCGKPATKVAMGYFTNSIADSVFCTKCANKQDEEGGMLPIINSPRVGVL